MKLVLSFTDESKSFAAGVELGRIIQRMENKEACIDNQCFPVRISNKKVIEDACKMYGYIPFFGQTYFNEWIEFTGIKKSNNYN